MARSYSGVIADTLLEESRVSVFRHAENNVSNKDMKERAISGFIINSQKSRHHNITHRVLTTRVLRLPLFAESISIKVLDESTGYFLAPQRH